MQDKSLRIVPRSQDFHWIAGHFRKMRDLGQKPAVRAAELKLAVGLSITLVTLLVDGAVVPATEQGEVRQRRGSSVRPVADVMTLAER